MPRPACQPGIWQHRGVEVLDIPLPAGPGPLRLRARFAGDTIEQAEVVTGLMHRGAEKLFESRDYRQILSLANRHDWLGSFDGEVSAARVMEDALGIVVPDRAQALRIAVSEVCRINHHLYWLGEILDDQGMRAMRARLTDALDLATGARMHLMITRIGGLSQDIPSPWFADLPLEECVQSVPHDMPGAGVAVLRREVAVGYATSGVVARASGWSRDLRTHVPPVVLTAGDARARLICLGEEIRQSVAFLRSMELPEGAIDTKLPRTIRLPEGQFYGASESATGINGWWIISRGDVVPWRMKLRSASFNNAQALGACLSGTRGEDVRLALLSFLLVAGDMDR